MDLWSACELRLEIGVIDGDLTRVVESQEQVATSGLVDDLSEQSVLETLLERTKPPLRSGSEGLHYLLATPFRYPPLRHGSRFGARHEQSLFYGGLTLPTALAETAYYRFVFWRGMVEPPPSGRFLTQHSAFGVRYRTSRGARLQDPPCSEHRVLLTHPGEYVATQRLGSAMRDAGMEAFQYVSARDKNHGINVALIAPAAMEDTAPRWLQHWLCETTYDVVRFRCEDRPQIHMFPVEDFTVEGSLPALR